MVAYAYFFVLDFIINILYTILFALIWFLIVSDSDATPSVGGKTFDSAKDAAGFVNPVLSDVAKDSNPNPFRGQLVGLIGQTAASSIDPGSAGATFSCISIIFFWLIKIYFIIIVFSYARGLVIRSHITESTFALQSDIWAKIQRKMLSSSYWKEDEEDYKTTSRRP